jgi:hypothetical protein
MFNAFGGVAGWRGGGVAGWRGGGSAGSAVKSTAPNGRDGALRGTHHSLVIRHFIGLNRWCQPLPDTRHAGLNRGQYNRVVGNRS